MGALRVRVRIMLGGRPAPGVHPGQGGGHCGRAAVDSPPPRRACEHCHTIPYEKGVCCSYLGVRVQCPKCHSWVWPQEKWACCGDGKRVLGHRYNPPLDEGYKALLKGPHVSYNSRLLNSALALGSQGTLPSREQGGLGMYEQGLAFLHLMGKVYLVLRSPSDGCNPFDSYLLPRQVLFDGASGDYGEDFAAQLVAFCDYLFEHHPFARRLRLAKDMPGERIDLNKVVRLEAHSEQSGALELELLDNGVERPGGEKNRVVYFDMKRKERGESPSVSVSPHNALFDLLMFPLLYEKGKLLP